MTNELEKILIPLIEKAASGAENAVDVIYAQAPEVIRQLLIWNAGASGLAFILISLGYLYFMCGIAEWRRENKSDNDLCVCVGTGVIGSLFALMLGTFFHAIDWLQILIAPKLYLLEYVARLAKGG
jgi:hypothetical protein